jgi:putative ABC transport system ATP-binding protein
MTPVIQLDSLCKTYTSGDVAVQAVRDVSLRIAPGEFVALLGSSGSGKSTLMNILGCLDRPSTGHYLLDGVDVSTLDRSARADLRNRKLGFVFQGFNLLARTSAVENVELPMVYSRQHIPSRQRREMAMKMLEMVGLSARWDHPPSRLSGGQQQRVAIARALVNNPSLLLADEPTGNLDSRTSVEIMEIFQRLNDTGITIVMVTHELDIAAYTKRNIVMRDGRIVKDDAVSNRLLASVQAALLPTAPTP